MSNRHRRRRRRLRDELSRRVEPGAPPGVVMPDPAAPPAAVHVLSFGPEGYEEAHAVEAGALPERLERWPMNWVNVDGAGDAALIEALGRVFGLHKLALEDVVHTHQRTKIESYGSHYFVVTRMPSLDEMWATEQMSIFFGAKFVLTIQERPGGDCLGTVRERIRSGWGRARACRSDCLVYMLLDAIVDHFFPLIEDVGARLDDLEADVERDIGGETTMRLHGVKRDLITVRRIMWPMRDALNGLLRDPSPMISDETRVYLRDVHDHAVQIIDLVESFRDVASGLTEIHLATAGRRTNETMKLLTMISTIFIPLTFLVGVYGMNFEPDASPWNMPELRSYFGYPIVWAVMAAVAAFMLWCFWRAGWIGGARRSDGREGGAQP